MIKKPDITKARKISFEPKIELYEGLKLTIEDFKNRLLVWIILDKKSKFLDYLILDLFIDYFINTICYNL